MTLQASSKRHPHNLVLCYHGCVRTRADVLTFREHIGDWIAQIRHLLRAGYTFVSPSQYLDWYNGDWNPPGPIACCHIDDGLADIWPACDWMAERSIPFGLAVIGRRQRKHEPEDGFAGWPMLRGYVDAGHAELLNHTFNMHHLAPVVKGGAIQTGPIMDSPAWTDTGDYVYIAPGDTRETWDFSHVDTGTLGFPLYGSDPFDGFATPITSTLRVVPKWTGTVQVLRFWQALGRPYGGGYSAQVEVRLDGTLVWSGTIEPVQYPTRRQWVEREMFWLTLDTPHAVAAGTPLEIEFKTLNAGPAVCLIYLVPDFSGDFEAETTCRALSQYAEPVPADVWPLITDFPAGYPWPGRAAIVLASGSGAAASDAQYEAYVGADLTANNAAIQTWLRAEWSIHAQAYAGDDTTLGTAELAGSHIGGAPIDIAIPFDCPATHTAEVVRWRNAGPQYDERYANLIDISIGASSGGPWTFLARYASRWRHYKWEEADIPPTALTGGVRYWLRFESRVPNPWGRPAVQRVLIDSVQDIVEGDAWPDGVHAYLETMSAAPSAADAPTQMIYPFGAFADRGQGSIVTSGVAEVSLPLQAALTAAGCDLGCTIYPARYERDDGTFREPGARYSRFTLGRQLIYGTAPPATTLDSIDAYAGIKFADVEHGGVRWQTSVEPDPAGNATVRHCAAALDFVAFDAWFANGAGGIARGALNDGGTYLEYEPTAGTYTPGETITEAGSGATAVLTWAEPAIGAMRVSAVSGIWTGGATITGVSSGATGVGQVPGPRAYADDKTWLQSRGVRCLLILNNNLGTGEPDPDIGSHVVNNPATYIPQIVAIAVDDGWDGITMNLEAVPAADRAAATAFFQQLASAMHAAGKLLHATAPATTGTDYDADWWCGWCDHDALARVCDAVKVLTYTESGPGTEPGSASPTWHFEATLAYLRVHVFAPFWPRLMIGARCFGHIWNALPDIDDAEYCTYAEAIAEGMLAAAEIVESDGEAYWTATNATGTRTCWFGTPHTVRRSVEAAARSGFGGVGIWKADDGDLYEYWPQWPQIGIEQMTSFSEERFPDDWAWFAVGAPAFKTLITEGDNAAESRVGINENGKRRYQLSRTLHNQTEVDWFIAFWQLRGGNRQGFRLRDWRDYKALNQALGVGTGAQTGFQLRKRYGNNDPVTGASSEFYRTIAKPKPGTVAVYLDGVAQPSGWTVSTTTGLVSFASAPGVGVIVSADCEFDVPVRFDNDEAPVQFDPEFGLTSLSGLRFREVPA